MNFKNDKIILNTDIFILLYNISSNYIQNKLVMLSKYYNEKLLNNNFKKSNIYLIDFQGHDFNKLTADFYNLDSDQKYNFKNSKFFKSLFNIKYALYLLTFEYIDLNNNIEHRYDYRMFGDKKIINNEYNRLNHKFIYDYDDYEFLTKDGKPVMKFLGFYEKLYDNDYQNLVNNTNLQFEYHNPKILPFIKNKEERREYMSKHNTELTNSVRHNVYYYEGIININLIRNSYEHILLKSYHGIDRNLNDISINEYILIKEPYIKMSNRIYER